MENVLCLALDTNLHIHMNRQISGTKINTVTTREFSALIKKFQVWRKRTKTRIFTMFPLCGETVISKFKGMTNVTEITRGLQEHRDYFPRIFYHSKSLLVREWILYTFLFKRIPSKMA
jgi:hypothetical protein